MRYFFIFIFIFFSSPLKAISISDYDSLPPDIQNWFIGGMAEGILTTHTSAIIYSDAQSFICLPPNTVFGIDLAKSALQTYKKSPSYSETQVATGLIIGLRTMFPCD